MKKDQPSNPYDSSDAGVVVTSEGPSLNITAETENDIEVDIVINSGEVRVEMRKCWDGSGWVDC